MGIKLEFVGKSAVRRNTMAFLDRLRATYPMLGEAGLHEVAAVELTKTAPRNRNYVQHLIGRDILGEDVDATSAINREDFLDVRIDDDGNVHERFLADEYQAAVDAYLDHLPSQIEAWPLMTRTEKQRILGTPASQRHRLIDPEGLSKTYVWRASTRWIAEVTSEDAAIIRESAARSWFRDVDRHGTFRPQRSWSLPVVGVEPFTDPNEAKLFEKDLERKHQWIVL